MVRSAYHLGVASSPTTDDHGSFCSPSDTSEANSIPLGSRCSRAAAGTILVIDVVPVKVALACSTVSGQTKV